MSASPSKWEAEKWAGEWTLCTFTISKSFSHVTEVTQMSLFHSFPIFTHLRFLAYQVTNCIWEGRKGCIRSFFWQPSSVPRGKKKKHTTPTPTPPKICLLQWIISADSGRLWCGGQSCIQSPVGAVGRHLRWWLSCVLEGKNTGGLFANELEGQFRQKLDRGSLFSKAEPLLWQMQYSHMWWASSPSSMVRAASAVNTPCCTSACRM